MGTLPKVSWGYKWKRNAMIFLNITCIHCLSFNAKSYTCVPLELDAIIWHSGTGLVGFVYRFSNSTTKIRKINHSGWIINPLSIKTFGLMRLWTHESKTAILVLGPHWKWKPFIYWKFMVEVIQKVSMLYDTKK